MFASRFGASLLFIAASIAFVPACRKGTATAKGGSQTTASTAALAKLSYDESCARMHAWPKQSELKCQTCISSAKLACECKKNEPYNGKCEAESTARLAEADCTSELTTCLVVCNDCACKQNCLKGHDACLARETPLQSCLAQTCESFCK